MNDCLLGIALCGYTSICGIQRCMGNIGHRACSSKRGGPNDNCEQLLLRHEVHPVALGQN